MPEVTLKYGSSSIPFNFETGSFDILSVANLASPLSEFDLSSSFDRPIQSNGLEDIVVSGESVLIVVTDTSREVGCGQVVNLIVRRLIAAGIAPFDIRVIIATGTKGPITRNEKDRILTPFITQRLKVLDHGLRDITQIIRVGETSEGIPVELNRALIEHDHIILVGGISFHDHVGNYGGPNLICPGLASARTTAAIYKLAFDRQQRRTRAEVGNGLLANHPVQGAFVEAAGKISVSFAVNTLVNDEGEITGIYCGEMISSYKAACEKFASEHTVRINGKRDTVIVDCGGTPNDLDAMQALNALETASQACISGGNIVLIAECPQDLGKEGILKWFDNENSDDLAERLSQNYRIRGEIAWSFLKMAETFKVEMVTELPDEILQKMRIRRMSHFDMLKYRERKGYIISGAQNIRVVTE